MLPIINLIGRLVDAPQVSYTTTQTAVAEFTVAASEKYKDTESTCFLPCICFGKPAENLRKFFQKGQPIHIVGRLKTEKWQKDGQNRSKIIAMVDRWSFVIQDKTEQTAPAESQETGDIPF